MNPAVARMNLRVERRRAFQSTISAARDNWLPIGRVLYIKKMLWENLDRHCAVEARVFRPVDFSHTASAERVLNFVRPEFSARR